MSEKDQIRRIEINEDFLIPDGDFCQESLGGATRRTSQRLDKQGLPYVMIAGRKWRPVKACRAWLANRIVVKRQEPTRRRYSARGASVVAA
jgi:hypothetical protein